LEVELYLVEIVVVVLVEVVVVLVVADWPWVQMVVVAFVVALVDSWRFVRSTEHGPT
jgi:hypothetical protein